MSESKKMKETKLEDVIHLKGDESIVNVLDRIFICLRDFSNDYLDEEMKNKLLNEMSYTIQSKVEIPIPSINNWLGFKKHEWVMDFIKGIKENNISWEEKELHKNHYELSVIDMDKNEWEIFTKQK